MRISKLALGFLLFASIQLSFGQTSPELSQPVDDLALTISANGLIKAGVPILQVGFRNLSDRELTVLLGIIGGSSPRPCHLDGRNIPCTLNFKLNVTDSGGTTRTYDFRGIMYVAGRIDPYVAHLSAQATYSLELGMDQFTAN